MKNLTILYFVVLTLAFFISNGQTSSPETLATAIGRVAPDESNIPDNELSAPSINEEEIVVTPGVKIYPEPFEGIVSVNLNDYPNAQIIVYDAKRNCIKNQQTENEEKAIFDLRNHPKGIYYLEIKVKGQKTTKAIYLQQKF